MPPPYRLYPRRVAALGVSLVLAGLAWAAIMPTVRTISCADGNCRIREAALVGAMDDPIGFYGVRAIASGGALGGGTGWLAVAVTHESDLLLSWQRFPSKAAAEAYGAPLAAWLAGDRRGPITVVADRGPAAYGLPGAIAVLGLALLGLAGALGTRR